MEYRKMEEEHSPTSTAPQSPDHPRGAISNHKPAVLNVVTSKQLKKAQKQNMDKPRDLNEDGAGNVTVVGDVDKFECPAGDRYGQADNPTERFRENVKRFVDHFIFRLVTILLILIDLSVVVTAVVYSQSKSLYVAKNLTANSKEDQEGHADFVLLERLDYVALAFSIYFVIEVSLRIFAQTWKVYFRQILEIIDFSVIMLTFIIVIVDITIDNLARESSKDFDISSLKTLTVFRFVRLIRFLMLLRVGFTQRQHLTKASRQMISENKRRFQKDGYDLDLCYITDRMIAMSFPSQGVMSIYRNPIEEVSRFFNTKYPNSYRIYNCCSERGYNGEKYFNSSVNRLYIDDHNVPTLQKMVDYAADVEQFMSKNRNSVIAIHCKGGKGRTGTMVCVWLLKSGAFTEASDALDYFASRRTDLSVGKAFQGVQTPSQCRYVNYYQEILQKFNGEVPPVKKLRPTKVSISGLKTVGSGDGKDLSFKFIINGEVTHEVRFGPNTNCTTIFERETHTLCATLLNSPVLEGDVKVRFETISKNIPLAYDGCPFFFWFNTSFVENNELSLGREELDNPHFKKLWRIYTERFLVTVTFEPV